MTLLHRLRCVALAVTITAPAMALPVLPAGASVIHAPAGTRPAAALPDTAWAPALPAGVAGLRVGTPQGTDCADCADPAAPSPRRSGNATLSVNVAILVLGTLWVALMLRRIQLRSAVSGFRGAAPRHAAGGH